MQKITKKVVNMSKIYTFVSPVKDSLGWKYPDALVAIRQWSVKSQDTGDSVDGDNYVESSDIEAIPYRANFYQDKTCQAEGKQSRPLINEDNPDDEQLFMVDLGHHESLQVRESDMSAVDKKWRLIELDVRRRGI